jgi:selenocysteine lyase/cysteine desulfurase
VGRRFEPGTAPYELLAGFSATIAYLESIGGMEAIAAYERELGQRFIDGLPDGATVYGLQTMDGRVPTFLINLEGVDAADAAKRLADEGFGVWAHDNWYSLGLREKLPYPDSAIRVGLIHYNTADEIDRFNAALAQL